MGTHRLIVVGGGIAGTSAAFAARRALERAGRADVEVVLVEEAPEVGGKARSVVRGAFLFEAGPNGYLDAAGELDELVTAAGLEKLPADAAAARRYLVRGGRVREIHAHPLRFAKSGILSFPAMLRIAAEPFVPRRTAAGDESAFDFATRRLGRQVAERLVQPMVQGIYAGDARELSLAAAFPRLAELEREHGSLLRGMRAKKRKPSSSPVGGPTGPAGTLTSFVGGLQSLPRGLAAHGGFRVRSGAGVTQLGYDDRRWRVILGGDALEADAVVLAVPAFVAAGLLEPHAPRAAVELARIDHPPVAVVALGFEAGAAREFNVGATPAGVPPGFGALVPRGEGFSVIGVLLESQIFAGRAPVGGLLVRAMLGGVHGREIAGLREEELIAIAREDVARLFGIRAQPKLAEAVSWPRAIPQYGLGHLERLAAIEAARVELVRARPGLHLAGNWTGGVAFARAARTGMSAGEHAAEELIARLAQQR